MLEKSCIFFLTFLVLSIVLKKGGGGIKCGSCTFQPLYSLMTNSGDVLCIEIVFIRFYGGLIFHCGDELFLFQPVSVLNIWVISNPFTDNKFNKNTIGSHVTPCSETSVAFHCLQK